MLISNLIQKFKRFTKGENSHVLVYMTSDLLAKGIPFLLLPIYTLFLTPEQFGNIAIYNVIVEILIIVAVLGGNSYLRVEFFKVSNSTKLFGSLLSNFIYTLPIAFLLVIVFIQFELDPAYHPPFWLYASLFIAFSQSVILLAIAQFQCQGKVLYVAAMNLTFAIITAAVTIIFLSNNYGEEARYIGYISASILVMVLGAILYSKQHQGLPKLNSEYSKPALKFGFGILPHALSWWARTGMDRMILAKYISVTQVGLYATAAQLSLVVIVFSNAVNQAFTPKIMKMLTNKQYSETVALCFKVILGYLFICILIAVSAPLIFSWFINVKFAAAETLLPLMCAVAFFQAVVTLFSNFMYFFKRVKLLSTITFLSSVLHVTLALYVVIPYGVEGVIYSSIATYFLSAVLIIFISISSIKKGNNSND